jgi:hypothetical protein
MTTVTIGSISQPLSQKSRLSPYDSDNFQKGTGHFGAFYTTLSACLQRGKDGDIDNRQKQDHELTKVTIKQEKV